MQPQQPARCSGCLGNQTLLIVIGLLVVLFFLTRGQGNAPADPTATPRPVQPTAAQIDSGVQLGEVVTASSLDRDSCPSETTTRFSPDDTIYIAVEESFIPTGTTIFARLFRGNDLIEDTDEIVAESDLNSCFYFEFSNDEGFDTGSYEIELVINGNAAGSVAFTVR